MLISHWRTSTIDRGGAVADSVRLDFGNLNIQSGGQATFNSLTASNSSTVWNHGALSVSGHVDLTSASRLELHGGTTTARTIALDRASMGLHSGATATFNSLRAGNESVITSSGAALNGHLIFTPGSRFDLASGTTTVQSVTLDQASINLQSGAAAAINSLQASNGALVSNNGGTLTVTDAIALRSASRLDIHGGSVVASLVDLDNANFQVLSGGQASVGSLQASNQSQVTNLSGHLAIGDLALSGASSFSQFDTFHSSARTMAGNVTLERGSTLTVSLDSAFFWRSSPSFEASSVNGAGSIHLRAVDASNVTAFRTTGNLTAHSLILERSGWWTSSPLTVEVGGRLNLAELDARAGSISAAGGATIGSVVAGSGGLQFDGGMGPVRIDRFQSNAPWSPSTFQGQDIIIEQAFMQMVAGWGSSTGQPIRFAEGASGVVRQVFYERSGASPGFSPDMAVVGDLGGNGRIERHVVGTNRNTNVAFNDVHLSGFVTTGVVETHGNVFVNSALSSNEGLENFGSLSLNGATVQSDGDFINHARLSVRGTLSGEGRLVNRGAFVQGDDRFVLALSGANENRGSIQLASGGEFVLQGAQLANRGSLNLNNGTVTGDGSLTNAAGGVVRGPGVVQTDFTNRGTLIVSDGTLTVSKGVSNEGLINLHGGIGALSGGTVDNRGVILGAGQIGGRVDNGSTGRVTASGGVLSLGELGSNTGQIGATAGSTLLVVDGLTRNAGMIALQGGTVDNNSQVLTNTGRISGSGTLRTDRVINQGLMQFTAGLSDVFGEVEVATGARVILSGRSTTTFYDDFSLRRGGELRVSADSAGVFFGSVNLGAGSLLTGTGTSYFEGGLAIGSSPGLVSTAGNITLGAGNIFTVDIGGLTRGVQYDALDVGGTLTLGGTLRLVSWDGFVGRAGDVFDLFNWGTLRGQFDNVDTSGLLLAGGAAFDFSQLYVDGSVRVVPLPAAAWLLLSGVAGLSCCRRTRRAA